MFVIHGRNLALRDGLYAFLRSLDLTPLPFEKAANLYVAQGSGRPPYVGEVVRHGLALSKVVIALVTADECVFTHPAMLSHGEPESRWAARPNVWFEAGMGFQMAPDRMVIAIEPGAELPSDVGGIQYFRLDNGRENRLRLRDRLIAAGCAVDLSSDRWASTATGGDLEATYKRPSPRSPW